MSVVTILARTKQNIDWKNLNQKIKKFDFSNVEVFPIIKNLKFEENGFGIALPNNYTSKEVALSELQTLVEFFNSLGFEVIELYNGEQITKNNIRKILSWMLPDGKN